MIEKIISGGQTGADQARLNVAIELGIPHGVGYPKAARQKMGRCRQSSRNMQFSPKNWDR